MGLRNESIIKGMRKIKEDKSEADRKFKELGYKKFEDNNNIKYYKGVCEIWFYKNLLQVENSHMTTMQELQAINKKCEELGWL